MGRGGTRVRGRRIGAAADRSGRAGTVRVAPPLRVLALVAGSAALVVGAVALLRPHGPSVPAPALAPDAETAYRALVEGTRLSTAGRNAESLPQLRVAVAGLPDTWEARFNLASSLENASLESVTRGGRLTPALRSSVERVQALAEAAGERERALALAIDAHRRAWTVFAAAKVRLTWGMPLDALELANRAAALDTAWSAPRLLAASITADLAGGGAAK